LEEDGDLWGGSEWGGFIWFMNCRKVFLIKVEEELIGRILWG
jgi:hypothetical protein